MGEATFPLSESVQTYLVTIARLRADGQPVPLSQLAQTLSISPVAVNEMCRKLQAQGLVIYQPYKGASLTQVGEQRAYYILRRHRLWEVFLVEKLGFTYDEAHEMACQLEHATSNQLADQLDAFLDHPAVNPQGDPIPKADGVLPACSLRPLSALSAGQSGHVIRCDLRDAERVFLAEKGVRPGASLNVLATTETSLLVQVGELPISLSLSLAEKILVELLDQEGQAPERVMEPIRKEKSQLENQTKATIKQVPLHELRVGQRGIVVRVGGKGPARRRMMDMGMVTGSEVTVVRVAPLGDPIEFQVKGYSLSLRKNEARDITVEVSEEEG